MKKINILKNNRDFNRIIKNNKSFKYKDYIIYIERDTNDLYKFGISVSKKIGNAVVRNKLKRQIKNINRTTFDNKLKKPPFIKEVARRLRRDGGFIRWRNKSSKTFDRKEISAQLNPQSIPCVIELL